MRTFKAKIGTSDETEADLEAILTVGEGQLLITAGDQEIGAWPVGAVNLDLTNRGYRMNIEGEALLVAPVDRFTFREAVDEERKIVDAKKSKKRRRSKKKTAPDEGEPTKRQLRAASKANKAVESKTSANPDQDKPTRRNWTSLSRTKKRPLSLSALQPSQAVENDAPWEVPVTKDQAEPKPNRLVALFRRIPLPWKIAVTGATLAFGVGVFFPRLVATVMLIPGLLAILTAGLGLIDPGYTRKLPAALDEQRLLTVGGILLAVGLMIVTFF